MPKRIIINACTFKNGQWQRVYTRRYCTNHRVWILTMKPEISLTGATFPQIQKGLLRYGETGNIVITLTLCQCNDDSQKATFEELEKKYVYVIGKDGKVHAREIKVAAELPHIYVVASGLGKDDRILLEGLRMVQENQKISSKYQKPEKVMSNRICTPSNPKAALCLKSNTPTGFRHCDISL